MADDRLTVCSQLGGAGIFKSPVFMAGPYTVQHTNGASSVSNDRADGAIVKVDAATGQPLWAIGMGSNVDTTRALGVVVDSEDNAVLTGEAHGGHDGNHQLALEKQNAHSE